VLSLQLLSSFMYNLMNTSEATQQSSRQPYEPEFFSELASIESKHFWFRARNRVIATLTEQITKDWPNGYRVLEVGCGTGNVLCALERACPRGKVVGMDLFAEGLAFARTRTSCPLVQGNLEQPAFGMHFDLIGAFDVVEHLSDDLQVFHSLHSMLKPGGMLLLTVPAHQSLWSYFDEASHHCRRYEPADLRGKLNRAGYEIDFLSQFMASIYPLMWMVRRIRSLARRGRNADSAHMDRVLTLEELRIMPVVNGLLTFVLMQESRLISSRIVLPFGTSLIVAARRMR
jgi:SAM-dependent methyltransferase